MAPQDALAQASVPTPVPEINSEDIETFLLFLAGSTGDKEVFTYALMDLESESVIPGCGVMHAKPKDVSLRFDSTLHVCLNRTNLRGRRTDNMVSARVLCCDLDNEIEVSDLKRLIGDYTPGLVVESSPKRYHLYWKLDSTIPLTVWSDLQLGLAHLLGGDYALRQVTHTIRVPGVLRMRQGRPLMPRIVYLDPEHQELTGTQVETIFPDILAAQAAAENKIKEQNKLIRSAIRKTKKGTKLTPKDAAGVGRNSYLYSYLREWISDLDDVPDRELVWAEALSVNGTAFESPLGEVEVGLVVKKALVRGLAAREFKAEKRQERLGSLGVPVKLEAKPVPQNGEFVNSGNGHTNGAHASFEYDYDTKRLKGARISDSGLIERITQRYRQDLIKCGKVTYAFQARTLLWIPQASKYGTEVIRGMALTCAEDLCHDPLLIKLCSDREGLNPDKLLKEQQKWHSHRSINGAISGVLDDESVRRETSSLFDAAPGKVYCRNGVVDMATGSVREALASDYMLKQSPVVFDPAATCDWWIQFLREVFAHNPEADSEIDYLQEAFGYSLSGSVDEQKIFIHTGEGSNGKSRVISALNALCGDYASRLSSNSLSKSKNAIMREIERIGAKIEGKRVVIIDDLDSRTQWNDAFIKALTDDSIIARKLYEEERDVPNRAKVHLCCNQVPEPEASNEALYRRLAILEYNRKFEVNAEKAREIKAKIAEELSGIFNWALVGYRRTLAHGGIQYPETVLERVRLYREATSNGYDALPEMFSEDLVTQMEALSPEAKENQEHWHTLDELLTFSLGTFPDSQVTKDGLGKLLTARKFKKDRRRKNGAFRMFYFVKISSNPLSML